MGIGNEVWIGDKEKTYYRDQRVSPMRILLNFDALGLLFVTSET